MISISLFQKVREGVHPYQYMSDWRKFDEILLPELQDFHSHLSMENITDEVYASTKRACKNF